MSDVRITHIGGPTALIEIGGWRILTDPTFDPPGKRYFFGWGTMSRKLAGPALAPAELGSIDAVLLSHDQHADNLDPAGRALLPGAGVVITTEAGARRLGGGARGLAPWASTTLQQEGRVAIEITATPCRHGPPLSRPIVGDVVGFALRWEGQEHGVLWISGDTVLYDGPTAVHDDRRGSGAAVRSDEGPDDPADSLRGLEALPPGPGRGRAGIRRCTGRSDRSRAVARHRHAHDGQRLSRSQACRLSKAR